MSSTVAQSLVAGALLAWFLIFPSLGLAQKYGGIRGVLVYGAVTTALLMLLAWHHRRVIDRLRHIDLRVVQWALVAVFAGVTALVSVLYPVSNSGEASWLSPSGVVGGGSDRDEALNLGVRAVLEGRYPYYERTHLDNLVSQLPGSLLLAMPFVVLGNVAWQNLVWLCALVAASRKVLGDVRAAVACLALILCSSPVVLQDIVTGGDLAANAIVVLAVLVLLLTSPPSAPPWQQASIAVAAGVAFSTRAQFWLLLPLLVAALQRRLGARAASLWLVVSLGTFALVTLPFYLYDPTSFSPLVVQNKFSAFDTATRDSFLILALLGVAAAALAVWVSRQPTWLWLVCCGLVLTAPALVLVALTSVRANWPELAYASYATPGLFFGVLGVLGWLWHSDDATGAGS